METPEHATLVPQWAAKLQPSTVPAPLCQPLYEIYEPMGAILIQPPNIWV